MRFVVLAATLALSAPAFAASPADDVSNGPASFTSGSDLLDTPGAHPQLDVCERLMERAFYLPDPASFDRAMNARREMELARDAFQDGDELACTRHATQALDDRT